MTPNLFGATNGTDFSLESTTVWSFPDRGSWATHRPDYRGNFSPRVVRNLILKYSSEGDWVLDPMVGSGTTLIEARLLNRNAIGLDINPTAVNLSRERLRFAVEYPAQQTVSLADARNLSMLDTSSIDLLVVHPPYHNLVAYSGGANPNDLSSIMDLDDFLFELSKAIAEFWRVVRSNRYCVIVIGDTRKAQHYVPLSWFVLQIALRAGFVLKEDIIKIQHNTTHAKRWRTAAQKHGFHLIMHEHIWVLRKPRHNEAISATRFSRAYEF